MNKKISKLCLFGVLLSFFAFLCTPLIDAYYQKVISGWEQSYYISNISFSLNGNTDENNVFRVSGSKLDVEDGYNINLELGITGSFTGSYAINYNIELINQQTNNDLATIIEVYQLIDGEYQYLCMLSELYETGINGYMGINDYKSLNYLLVYSANAGKSYESYNFAFEVRAGYVAEASGLHTNQYYISNAMIPTGSNFSLFKLLSNNINDISGKILTLTEDIEFPHGENIVFSSNVGIDLNGHTLNLNGGTLKIEYSGTKTEDVIIRDNKHTGSIINGQIEINSPNDLILIDDYLSDNILITDASLIKFGSLIENNLTEYEKETLTSKTNSVTVNALENLKSYLTKNIFTLSIIDANGNEINQETEGFLVITRPENTQVVDYTYNIIKNDQSVSLTTSLSVLGTSSYSIGSHLLDMIPEVISSNVYLPVKDDATQALFTWITSNKQLLNQDGIYLPNGISDFYNYLNDVMTISVIVEVNKQTTVISKDVEVEILSLEDRVELIYNYEQVIFSEVGDSYHMDIPSMMIKKLNLASYDEYLGYMNNTYHLEVPVYSQTELDNWITAKYLIANPQISDEELYQKEFEAYLVSNELVKRLGLLELDIDNNSIYTAHNTFMTGDLTNHYLDVLTTPIYSGDEFNSEYFYLYARPVQVSFEETANIIFTFKNSLHHETTSNIIKEKKIIVVGTSQEEELVDPTNEIKAPFIRYEVRMNDLNNPYESGFTILSNTSDGFDIIYRITSPANASNYLTIENNGTNALVKISEGLVPSVDTPVHVVATVQGIDYHIDFTIPGLLHNEDMDIADPSLYFKLLAAADQNNDAWLSRREASLITNLNIDYVSADITKIENLKGIEFFNNLVSLSIQNHSIIDISYLENMMNLTSLNLSGNLISSINSLVYLDALRNLDLSNNRIVDIKPIEYLINIETLDLTANKLVSYEALQNYQALTTLSLASNDIANTDDSNRYYLIMAYNNTLKNNKPAPNISQAANTFMVISENEQVAVEVMRNIFVASETYTTLYLPSSYVYNGNTYNISWVSSDNSVIEFDPSYPGGYLLTQPLVDQDIEISVNVALGLGTPYASTRKFHINVLQSASIPDIAYIEIEDGVFQKLYEVVSDKKLRSELFNMFNTNKSENVVYTDPQTNCDYTDEITLTWEEITTITSSSCLFANKKITNLNGINYFTGITKLDLSGNNINDLSPIQHLTNLKVLTLSGKEYDFNQLVWDADHQKANRFTLEALYLDGCFKLDDDETLTMLYHVYRNNNNTIKIFLEEEVKTNVSDDYGSNYWDPFAIPLNNFIQQLPSYAAFIEKNETFNEVKRSYDVYFYDDLIPFTFTVNNLSGSCESGSWLTFSTKSTYHEIKYTKLTHMTDVVMVKLTLTNGKQTISGKTISITATASKYLQVEIDYNVNEYMIVISSDNIVLLGDIFPGRDLRKAVMNQLDSKDFNTTDFYTVDGQKYVTVNGLKNLNITSITINGDVVGDYPAITGLKYLKKITELTVSRDFNPGDGSELINLTKMTVNWSCLDLSKLSRQAIIDAAHLIYGNDLSAYSDTLEQGFLRVNYFVFTNTVGAILYNQLERNNQTDFDNPEKYYLNYFPMLETFKFTRTSTDASDIADFRGLRAYVSGNKISSLDIHYNTGSKMESATTILTSVYENSTASSKTFLVSNTLKGSGSKEFVPNGVLIYSENEQIIGEYTEFARYIYDLGVTIDNLNHYQLTSQVINSSIYLPKIINPFKVILKNGDELIIKNEDQPLDYNYREFDIDWYINCTDLTIFKMIFPDISVDETPVYTYQTSDSSTSNLKRYRITNMSDSTMNIVKPTYDYYCFFEGVIGNRVSGINIEGLTKYTFTYPIIVKGTTAYDVGYSHRYTIDNDIYYSYDQIEDVSLRLAMFISLEGSINNKSSDIGGLIRYAYDNNTNGAKLINKLAIKNNAIGISYNNADISTERFNSILNSYGASASGFKNIIYSVITLRGMEIFTNITSIDISGDNIADISALASMTNLTTIDLNTNAIYDISCLKNLTNLTSVNLANNNIETTVYQTTINGVDYYRSIFANSLNTLTTLNISANSSLNELDVRCLAGDVNVSTKALTATSNKIASLNLNTLNNNYTYDFMKAVNDIVSNSTIQNISININGNMIEASITEWMDCFETMIATYYYAQNTPHPYNTTDFTYGLGYTTDIYHFELGTINTNGTFSFNSDYSSTMNAIQGIFDLDIIYTVPLKNSSYQVIIPYACYIDVTRQTRDIYVQFGGTEYDEASIYTIEDELIPARMIFEQSLLLYFLTKAEYTTSGTGSSDILLYEDSINNVTVLIFKSSLTSLAITSDNTRYITSLAGVELITSLTSISVNNNGITVLPNYTVNNKSLTSFTLETNSLVPAGLTSSELYKLTKLPNLTTLKLINYDGAYNTIMANNQTFIEFISTHSNLSNITLNIGAHGYIYESTTINSNSYQTINYTNTLINKQNNFKTPTNAGTAKIFGLNTGRLLTSYGDLYLYQIITGTTQNKKTNMIDNTYTKIMYQFFESSKAKLINIDNNNLSNFTNYTTNNLLSSIFSMGVTSTDNVVIKKRSLELGFLNIQTYNLPVKFYVNGYEYKTTWELPNTTTGITIKTNVLTIKDTVAVSNVSLKSNNSLSIYSASPNIEVMVNASYPDTDPTSIIGDCFVEISDGVYKKANDVFVSGRLIYILFNNKAKKAGGSGLTSNNTTDKTKMTFLVDGISYTAENRYILSQAEIKAVTEISLPNPGVTSLTGLEYYTNLKKFIFTGNAITSIEPLTNMQLTVFNYSSTATTLYVPIFDFTPLYNSRTTLTEFRYGFHNSGNSIKYLGVIDFDFLTSFGTQLKTISITGKNGVQNIQSIKYLASWFLINRGVSIQVMNEGNTDSVVPITSGDKKAMNIMKHITSVDSTVTYYNESYLQLTQGENGILYGYLPSILNYGGIEYDITWQKFSGFMNITYDDSTKLYYVEINNFDNNTINSSHIGCIITIDDVVYSRVLTIHANE